MGRGYTQLAPIEWAVNYTDRGSNYTDYTDRGSNYADYTDRGSNYTDYTDRGSNYADYTDRGSNYTDYTKLYRTIPTLAWISMMQYVQFVQHSQFVYPLLRYLLVKNLNIYPCIAVQKKVL